MVTPSLSVVKMGLFREGGLGILGSLERIQGPGQRRRRLRVRVRDPCGVGLVSRGFRAGVREEGLGGGLLAGFGGRLSGKLNSGWALEQAYVTH